MSPHTGLTPLDSIPCIVICHPTMTDIQGTATKMYIKLIQRCDSVWSKFPEMLWNFLFFWEG